MPLNKVVRPAMKLAEEGFVVNDALADDLKTYGSEVLPNHENSKAIFWKDGEPLKRATSWCKESGEKHGNDCREWPGCVL